MAKTIKDLAEHYAYTNWESDDYHEGASEGLPFDPIGHTEKTFKAGANAVLEEIESCYNKDDSLCVIAHKILSKIQELKGE